uniref:DNA-directed RNA polymerase n=1 Tax=Anolis carolinensis TaxID=28377 RepID=A0A803TB76_ANOCA
MFGILADKCATILSNRLREILMVASANIKTPMMSVPVLNTAKAHKRAKRLKKQLTRVCLGEVLEKIDTKESLRLEEMQNKHRFYTIRFSFLPYECYREEKYVKPSDILRFMESRFFKMLLETIKKKSSKLALYNTVSTRRAAQRDVNDGVENVASQENQDNNEAEPEEEGRVPDGETGEEDADAADAKRKANQEEEVDYESDDANETEDEDIPEQEENEVNPDEPESQDEPSAPCPLRRKSHKKKKEPNEFAQQRISAVLESHGAIESYTYDTDNELWCEISLKLPLIKEYFDLPSLVTSLANNIVIHETKGITRCLLNETSNKNGEVVLTLQTEGINLPELFRYADIIDVNKLYCNDIHAVASTYGIEAALKVLEKEIKDVFAAYGKTVVNNIRSNSKCKPWAAGKNLNFLLT